MAGEITFTASLTCTKLPPQIAAVTRGIVNGIFNSSGGLYVEGILAVSHSAATAFPLASLTTLGWMFAYNSDATNFCTLRNGSGGADFIELKAGEVFFGPLLPACVPYALADTANVNVEYLIFAR